MLAMSEPILLPEKWGRTLLDGPTITPGIPELPKPPQGTVECACGKKHIPLSEVKIHNTQFAKGASDTICNECLNNINTHSMIVCLGCKAVVARVPPHRQPNGFRFEPNGYYHVSACPNCVKPPKSIEKSMVIEAEVYARENGLVSKIINIAKT